MKFTNYLAAGKAVIATDVGDIAKIIREKGNGLIVEDDPSQIADAVFMMKDNPKGLKMMGDASKSLSENKLYSWEFRTRQIEKLFTSIK